MRLSPVRCCKPEVDDSLLRKLPNYFPTPDSRYKLDRTYERTEPSAIPEHVAIFDDFKLYRNARLLRPVEDKDLFFAALNETTVELTVQGKAYRGFAEKRLL